MAVTRIWDADNNTWQLVGAGPVAPSQGYLPGNPIYYTASGTFEKASFPGMVAALVECQGAGGGSGACAATGAGQNSTGGGGHGGGYAQSIIPVSNLDASEAVTVGARGAAGSGGGSGGTGGDSIFDTISGEVRGVGGGGGQPVAFLSFPAVGDPGGASGAGGTGDQVELGGAPSAPMALAVNTLIGSKGGGSHFGSGLVRKVTGVTAAGIAETTPGVGATGPQNGASAGAQNGQLGGPGLVIVTPLYATDAAGPTGPQGKLSLIQQTATHAITGTTPVLVNGMTTTVTIPANRLIRVSVQCLVLVSSTGAVRRYIIYMDGAQMTPGSYGIFGDASQYMPIHIEGFITPTAGSHTFAFYAQNDAGTVDIYSRALLVEDIGAA